MCGFVVLVGELKPSIRKSLEKATSLIKHRGPDDEGYALIEHCRVPRVVYCGGDDTVTGSAGLKKPFFPNIKLNDVDSSFQPNIVMGHRRLAIVDRSPMGHQPMAGNNNDLVLVYNGEIYNHVEIRKELENEGVVFFSNGDTEVLLRAYERWGVECLNKLNGMFAFVIYDYNNQKLFVARDRYGVKPLYYWKSAEGFYAFASEIKQFTVLPGWKAVLNNDRGFDFLKFGWLDHTKETLFKDVYQLRGGECGEVFLRKTDTDFVVKPWYRFELNKYHGSFDEAAEKFRMLLLDAVQLRLRADVPVGTCLSGGLDSSSVVCLIDQFFKEKDNPNRLMTYSARSQYPEYDEKEFMDAVIQQSRVAPQYCYPDVDQLFEELDVLTWHQDEPFGSTSIYAQRCVFKTISKTNVRVVLDGYGADESLAGYYNFRPYFNTLFRQGQWVRLISEIKEAHRRHSGWFPRTVLREWLSVAKEVTCPKTNRRVGQAPTWLNSYFLGNVDSSQGWSLFFNKRAPVNLLALSIDSFAYAPMPEQLHWADRNSMTYSIEQRCPFMDYRIVEFLRQCPDEYKVRNGQTKAILRKAMAGVLPDAVCQRDSKLGFAVAEEHWMKNERPGVFKQMVRSAVLSAQGILTSQVIEIADQMIAGDMRMDSVLWRWISFARWMDQFSVEVNMVGLKSDTQL